MIPPGNRRPPIWWPMPRGGRYAVLPIAAVEKLSGLAIFPGLGERVKQTPLALPRPKPYNEVEVIEDNSLVPQIPQP